MSKPLLTALAAVFGLSTLAGCSHFHQPEPAAFTPVVEAPPPAVQPTYRGKYR
jgi:hypothetical protein